MYSRPRFATRTARESGDAIRNGSGGERPARFDPRDHRRRYLSKCGSGNRGCGLRLQLKRAVTVCALAWMCSVASAQPSATPPTDPPAPTQGSDDPNATDYRDVLSDPPPTRTRAASDGEPPTATVRAGA